MRRPVRAHFVPVFAERPPRPYGKRAQKRAGFLIARQKRDLFCGLFGVGQIGLRQQLPRMIELLLKTGILLLQPALQRALAVTQLLCRVVDGAFPAGQQLHQRAADAGGVAVVRFHHRKAAFQLRLEKFPHRLVAADKRRKRILFGKHKAVFIANSDRLSDKVGVGAVLHRPLCRCGQRHDLFPGCPANQSYKERKLDPHKNFRQL